MHHHKRNRKPASRNRCSSGRVLQVFYGTIGHDEHVYDDRPNLEWDRMLSEDDPDEADDESVDWEPVNTFDGDTLPYIRIPV